MFSLKKKLTAALVAVFFIVQASSALAEEAFLAAVKQCIDGDTLVLDTGQRVRFAGVDTPEKGSKETPPQYYASEARNFTCQQVKGKQIRVVPLSQESRDRYHRLVAEIRLPDGRSLNELLLQEGMATFYFHKNLPADLVRRLTAAQRDAIDRRKGCWAFVLDRPEAQDAFTGNANSRRFFSEACLRKANVAKRNQIRFDSLEEAFKKGFAPVRECGIWPPAK